MKTYQSKFYHNKHSEDRDKFLIERFGQQWLWEMKSRGYFGGEWSDSVVGTPKKSENWRSRAYDSEGREILLDEVYIDARSA